MGIPKFTRDELSEKLHEGTVGLARTRKSEDGSVRYFDVYGDMHDDIDYS